MNLLETEPEVCKALQGFFDIHNTTISESEATSKAFTDIPETDTVNWRYRLFTRNKLGRQKTKVWVLLKIVIEGDNSGFECIYLNSLVKSGFILRKDDIVDFVPENEVFFCTGKYSFFSLFQFF